MTRLLALAAALTAAPGSVVGQGLECVGRLRHLSRHRRITLLLVAALGCSDHDVPVAPNLDRPGMQLVDGGHGGGNASFYFLAPITWPFPRPAGTLDAAVLPHLAVAVCGLDAEGRCAEEIVTFTADGERGRRLRLVGEERPHFFVTWWTREYVALASEAFGSASLPSFAPNPPSFRSLPFSAPATFTAGDQFAIVLKNTTGSCGVFQGPVGTPYAGGDGWFDARPNQVGVSQPLSIGFGRADLAFQTIVR